MKAVAPLDITKTIQPADVLLQLTTTAGTIEAQHKVVTREMQEREEALAAWKTAQLTDPKYHTKKLAAADEQLDTIKAELNELRVYCRDNGIDFNKLVQFNNLKNELRSYYYYVPE